MELFDRKSPAFTKVVTGVSQQTGITFHNGDIVEEVIMVASDIGLPPAPSNVMVVKNGVGLSEAISYVSVLAYRKGVWSNPSSEVVVNVLSDTTSAVISWNAVVDASNYRVYVGSVTGTYTDYIETDALNIQFVGATLSDGSPLNHAISDKEVMINTTSGGAVLATLTLTANNVPLKSSLSFIAGADTSTLFFTPAFGLVDIIINYRPSQRLFSHAAFSEVVAGTEATIEGVSTTVTLLADTDYSYAPSSKPTIVQVLDSLGKPLTFERLMVSPWTITIPSTGDEQLIEINLI